MEFVAHRNVLMLALSRANSVSEKKTTMPILSNVLVETESSDTITVKATDLEFSLIGTYQVDVVEAGSFCLPTRLFLSIVKSLPEGNVNIKLNAETNQVEIRGEKDTFFAIHSIPPEDFPALPSSEDVGFVSIPKDTIVEGLSFVLPASAIDDPRIYLNSVYFEGRGPGKLRFVSTDGHKLGMFDAELGTTDEFPKGLIVPRKGVSEILSLIEEPGEDEVHLGFTDTHLFLKKQDVEFSCRLIDSTFPNYEMVIPTSHDYEITINKNELKEAMQRIAVLALQQKDRNPRIDFAFETGRVIISSTVAEYGTSTQPVPIQYSGKTLNITFSYNTLSEMISVFRQENIIMKITTPTNPVVINGEDYTKGIGVVMPSKPD